MAKLSKFDVEVFFGGYDELAISKQRYTKEQAIEQAKLEYKHRGMGYIAIGDGYARHRAGVNEDNEPCVGWWLEYEEHSRSCPCWVMHWCKEVETDKFAKDYEYISVK